MISLFSELAVLGMADAVIVIGPSLNTAGSIVTQYSSTRVLGFLLVCDVLNFLVVVPSVTVKLTDDMPNL